MFSTEASAEDDLSTPRRRPASSQNLSCSVAKEAGINLLNGNTELCATIDEMFPSSLPELTQGPSASNLASPNNAQLAVDNNLTFSVSEIRQLHINAMRCQAAVTKWLNTQRRILSQRHQFQNHRDGLFAARRSLEKSNGHVLDLIEQQRTQHAPDNRTTAQHLASVLQDDLQHRKDFMDRIDEFKSQEEDLGALELSHQRRAEKLVVRLQALGTASQTLGVFSSSTFVPSEMDTTEDSASSDMPSLVQCYFDKAGDANIAWERLSEIVLEWEEEVSKRELQEDQGEKVEMTESDFEKDWQERRRKAENAYSLASTAAEELRRQCLQAGLDPNGWRKPPSETSDASPMSPYIRSYQNTAAPNVGSHALQNISAFEKESQNALYTSLSSRTGTQPVASDETNEMIENWRRRISPNPSDDNRSIPERSPHG